MTTRVAGVRVSHSSLSTHALLKHDLGESFAPQLFVDAKEVSFCHFASLAVDHELFRNGDGASHDLSVGCAPYDDMPLWHPAWRRTGPSQLINRVSDHEVSCSVCHVIFVQEFDQFLSLKEFN